MQMFQYFLVTLFHFAMMCRVIVSSPVSSGSCSSLYEFGDSFNLTTAKFERANARRVPKYDHMSCFVMKSRYNCAHAVVPDGKSILDWDFVLKPSPSLTCSVGDMLHMTGGMQDIARRVRNWSHRPKDSVFTNVLIVGNSFLRQVWESLVCTYRDEIIGGFVEENGPVMDIAVLRQKKSYSVTDVGKLIDMKTAMEQECHYHNMLHYYGPDVTPPRNNNDNCSDDIAMVEFKGHVRFFYIFRHFVFAKELDLLMDKIGLKYEDIDAIVGNGPKQEYADIVGKISNEVPAIDFSAILTFFRSTQQRDTRFWSGADNVGCDTKPDIHPCMPGIPDDEASILLFALSHKLSKFHV